jgi:hypothetical protein
VQADPPTKESLSQLVIQLIQYQETKLGKNSQDSSMTTRLPVSGTSGYRNARQSLMFALFSDAIFPRFQARWRALRHSIHHVSVQERAALEEIRLYRQQSE